MVNNILLQSRKAYGLQRGIATLELIIYIPILMMIIFAASDFYRYLLLQDRLHLTAVSIGALAADITPENQQNKPYEALLCGQVSATDNNIICPNNKRLDNLLKIALETMALDNSQNFAMQIEFIDRAIADYQYAKTERLGMGSCTLDNNTTGGIRIADYLTSNKSRPPVDLKNRAQHQFIYLTLCYQFTANWFDKRAFSKTLYADSFNLRRYWYSGDSVNE